MSKHVNECLVCDGADAEAPLICSHCVKNLLGVSVATFEKAIGIRDATNAPSGAPSGARHSHDTVNHPSHYTSHPSGVECIQITEHANFCVGNAIKYLWRAGSKGSRLEDLRKAKWYIERELSRLEAAKL